MMSSEMGRAAASAQQVLARKKYIGRWVPGFRLLFGVGWVVGWVGCFVG
jgi:hypothetical protein